MKAVRATKVSPKPPFSLKLQNPLDTLSPLLFHPHSPIKPNRSNKGIATIPV